MTATDHQPFDDEAALGDEIVSLIFEHIARTDADLLVAVGGALGSLAGFLATVHGKAVALEYLQAAAEAVEALPEGETEDLIARIPEGRA